MKPFHGPVKKPQQLTCFASLARSLIKTNLDLLLKPVTGRASCKHKINQNCLFHSIGADGVLVGLGGKNCASDNIMVDFVPMPFPRAKLLYCDMTQ